MACQHALDALHGREEVCDLDRGQVRQAAVRYQRADEDVTWQQGLKVDEGEGVGGREEDLARRSVTRTSLKLNSKRK